MKRHIDQYLLNWKQISGRKVLLVRGARQVGKTYSIRTLAKQFRYKLEVNFEEDPAIKSFFEGSLSPQHICEKLSAYFNIPIVEGETFLFFDEIQACPNALKSLRFFYEKMPDLHVVAAGSLLELALGEIPSFGVGRISSLFMYPMTFGEFLIVTEGQALSEILNSSYDKPIDAAFHQRLMEKFRVYSVIGGMPSIVESYRVHRDMRKCQNLIDELVINFQDDFAKYREQSDLPVLQEVFSSIVQQTGRKFKYSNISTENKTYHYKRALDLLVKAGLAHKVYHTSARGIPLGAQVDDKKFKVLLWDIGVYQRLLGLNLSEFLVQDDCELINKGSFAELFVGLEFIGNSSPLTREQLYYWHREARSSNAELDYVIQKDTEIIPVEVKSGIRGKLQSMNLFLEERDLKKGICFSPNNFFQSAFISYMPIYMAGQITKPLKTS
jgi:predicted AAA+ superfamily ATPase